MFEYNSYPFFLIIAGKTLFGESSFEFSPKAEFTSPLYVWGRGAMFTSPAAPNAMTQQHSALHNYFSIPKTF